MSYQVLARKWRPKRFSELVGQSHVVSAITHALNNNRLHHAYLFTGTRGVGKTTIARIFSKSLNCEEGQSADPCGKCDTCLSIEQGNYVDLLEIDAASRTKVEDTRELLDNVQYKPTRGSFKVYLIDEVHMLSKHSFNALLKTLEEPPPHVKFLLATTDPQKLPITILSRCLQFNLKALSRQQIADQLHYVLEHEGLASESSGIELLARAANGSMRDALSLTDQAIAQGDNRVTTAIVTNMLGLMDKQLLLKLLNAIVSKDKIELFANIQSIAEQSPDYAQVFSELSSLLHQIALTQWAPEACKLETTSARAIYSLSKKLPPEHVQLLYKFVIEGKKELPFSVDGRTCLEMTVIRMLQFAPQNSIAEPLSEIVAVDTNQTNNGDRIQEVHATEHESLALEEEQSLLEAQRAEMQYANEPTVSLQESQPDSQTGSDHRAEYKSPEETPVQAEEEVALAQPAPAQVHSDDNGNASQTALQKTQALLALRKQLANDKASQEEGEQVKKSESPLSPPPTSASTIESSESENAQHEAPPWVTEPIDEFSQEITEAHPELESEPETLKKIAPTSEYEAPRREKEFNQSSELTAYLESGEKLVHAKQINGWARLIESTSLSGLIKQVALHSAYVNRDNNIELLASSAQQHLVNDQAIMQIQAALQDVLNAPVKVNVSVGQPKNTPFQIQQEINAMRLEHAKSTIEDDAAIQALKNTFDAKIDSASIQPR